MLRITRTADGDGEQLKLEGRLLGPWVEELGRACTGHGAGLGPLRLDLAGLTFVDGPGLRLLRELLGRGVVVAASSGFVAELLRLEKP
jgi:hypothetical protein